MLLFHQARIQINMSVKKMEMFEALSSIKDTLIPILWFEEGIDELGDYHIIPLIQFGLCHVYLSSGPQHQNTIFFLNVIQHQYGWSGWYQIDIDINSSSREEAIALELLSQRQDLR